jgi:hypothetical protein
MPEPGKLNGKPQSAQNIASWFKKRSHDGQNGNCARSSVTNWSSSSSIASTPFAPAVELRRFSSLSNR